MQIDHTFTVERSPEQVWDVFQDVPAVSQCMPGAEITEDKGDGVYAGKLTVKLGPMSSSFEGEATVAGDHDAMTAHIKGKGVDRRGGSRGRVDVDYALVPVEQGTEVSVNAEIHLSGAIAQFGRTGLINEMSTRLIDEFVDCLHRKLDAETPEEAAAVEASPVHGISLFLASLVATVSGFVRRLFTRD